MCLFVFDKYTVSDWYFPSRAKNHIQSCCAVSSLDEVIITFVNNFYSTVFFYFQTAFDIDMVLNLFAEDVGLYTDGSSVIMNSETVIDYSNKAEVCIDEMKTWYSKNSIPLNVF